MYDHMDTLHCTHVHHNGKIIYSRWQLVCLGQYGPMIEVLIPLLVKIKGSGVGHHLRHTTC